MSRNLLQRWEEYHKKEILKELKQAGIELTIQNIPKIINETSFKVRSRKHKGECSCYDAGSSCHPEIKDLNCFLCSCPQYISESELGGCKINSRFGKVIHHQNLPAGRVWDCSDCKAYHHPKAVEKYLKDNMNNLR